MATVVIVDQSPARISTLRRVLTTTPGNIRIHSFASPLRAITWAKDHSADLIIANYGSPFLNGVETIRQLRRLPQYLDTGMLLLTTQAERHAHYRALEAGVSDFLANPIDEVECRTRCANLLRLQRLEGSLGERLGMKMADSARQLRIQEKEILLRLARAGEYRDEGTGNHVLRIAHYARDLAETLGLDAYDCELIEQAAPMHDIGKVGIPDPILLKSGQLNEAERKIMQSHTRIGYEILRESPSECLQMGAAIALHHHENYNGKGYPERLSGEEIPLAARIVAVADVYDALTSVRPYKAAWPHQSAMDYLVSQRGKQFDPDCVDAFSSRPKQHASRSLDATTPTAQVVLQ